MPLDDILIETEEQMEKAIDHLQHELRGIRTGRASPALIEYVKVDYYGSPTDLKNIASITVPEGTQLLVRPFTPADIGPINKAINDSGLGLTAQSDGKQIRINLPAMSQERRKQLVAQCKDAGEKGKIAIRNARRDGNKAIDTEQKDGLLSEDEAERSKTQVQDLTKQYEDKINDTVKHKEDEVMAV